MNGGSNGSGRVGSGGVHRGGALYHARSRLPGRTPGAPPTPRVSRSRGAAPSRAATATTSAADTDQELHEAAKPSVNAASPASAADAARGLRESAVSGAQGSSGLFNETPSQAPGQQSAGGAAAAQGAAAPPATDPATEPTTSATRPKILNRKKAAELGTFSEMRRAARGLMKHGRGIATAKTDEARHAATAGFIGKLAQLAVTVLPFIPLPQTKLAAAALTVASSLKPEMLGKIAERATTVLELGLDHFGKKNRDPDGLQLKASMEGLFREVKNVAGEAAIRAALDKLTGAAAGTAAPAGASKAV